MPTSALYMLLVTAIGVAIIGVLIYLYGMVLVWTHLSPKDWPGRVLLAALFGLLTYDLLMVLSIQTLR